MNRQQYREYLRSAHWQRIRRRILARAKDHCEWCHRFCGRSPHPAEAWCGSEDCEWCNAYFTSDGDRNDREIQSLDIHHKTYERVGQERDEDLVALCWSCHDEVTDRMFELRELARAGRIPRVDATPDAAATRWTRLFWGLLSRKR